MPEPACSPTHLPRQLDTHLDRPIDAPMQPGTTRRTALVGARAYRGLATGEFLWMADMARILPDGLGERGRKVATRQVPDFVIRLLARFRDPSLREITPSLGRRNRHSTEKARTLLGWQPRPARQTVLDCAESLMARGAV